MMSMDIYRLENGQRMFYRCFVNVFQIFGGFLKWSYSHIILISVSAFSMKSTIQLWLYPHDYGKPHLQTGEWFENGMVRWVYSQLHGWVYSCFVAGFGPKKQLVYSWFMGLGFFTGCPNGSGLGRAWWECPTSVEMNCYNGIGAIQPSCGKRTMIGADKVFKIPLSFH